MIFGIMGAMPDEVDQLCARLENVTVEPYGGVEYHKGTLAGKQVVVCCAGMGKANAAATTQVLITKFGAEKIIFSGIAGNMTSKIGIGDVVIGKTVLYHDAQLDMICQNPPFLKEYTGDPELIAAAGGGDQFRVAGVFLQERRVLADHIQLGVVVQHRLADDHIADADLAGHVARNAGEDDLLRAELGNEHLRGSGGVGLAHTGAAHHHLLAGQRALVVLHAAVGFHGDVFQAGTQLIDFIGHCAHNTKNHRTLLTR